MKKTVLLPLLSGVILSAIHAEDTFRTEVENVYLKAANTLLFFTSENIISSGSYTFSNDDQKLRTYFFPMTHHFKSNSDFYNFYVDGSVGYSKYEETNILFRGSVDDLDIRTYALKLGGGIRMNLWQDTDMMIGGAYIYSKANSDYHTPNPLVPTDSVDRTLDYVFNSSNSFDTYEFYSSIGYHPSINGYDPYLRADLRYFDTSIDDPYATISDISSTVSKLKAGVITPAVAKIADLPLRLEFYAWDVLLSGDMKEALDMRSFYVFGTTFHLGTATLNDWVSDVSFDVNIVTGDNIDGFNFGFGFAF